MNKMSYPLPLVEDKTSVYEHNYKIGEESDF